MMPRKKFDITDSTIMLDRNQVCRIFSLGIATIDKIAIECGAKIKIGRRVLYNRTKLEKYFKELEN